METSWSLRCRAVWCGLCVFVALLAPSVSAVAQDDACVPILREPVSTCEVDEDCGEGQTCYMRAVERCGYDEGRGVEGCGFYGVRHCTRPEGACATAEECADGFVCEERMCDPSDGSGCQEDESLGSFCVVEARSCTRSSDCGGGSLWRCSPVDDGESEELVCVPKDDAVPNLRAEQERLEVLDRWPEDADCYVPEEAQGGDEGGGSAEGGADEIIETGDGDAAVGDDESEAGCSVGSPGRSAGGVGGWGVVGCLVLGAVGAGLRRRRERRGV